MVAAQQEESLPRTPRQAITDLADDLTAGQEQFCIPLIVDQIVDAMPKDWNTYRAFVRPAVYQTVAQHLGGPRRLVVVGTMAMSREELKKQAEKLREKWARVNEWLPSRGCHVALFFMTKGDLLEAARHRRERAGWEMRRATLWERLAEAMDEGQTVAQRFTPEELEALSSAMEGVA